MGRAGGAPSGAPARPRAPAAAAAASAPREPDAAAAPRRADRARDPHRRPARRLGRGLRVRPQARPVLELHDRHRRRRQRLGAARASSSATTLTTVGLKQEDLDAKLGGYVQRRDADAERRGPRRTGTAPRPRTRARSRRSSSASTGSAGSAATSSRRPTPTTPPRSGQLLEAQMQRLQASDVVWADLFRAPAAGGARGRGDRGRAGPASVFVPTDDLTSASALAAVWQRMQDAAHRRHAERPARQPDRVRQGPSERPAAVHDDRDDDQGVDTARVRGRRRGLGRQPGGPGQGDAHDPEAARIRSCRRRPSRSSIRARRRP